MQEVEGVTQRIDDLVLNGYRHVVESGGWDVDQLHKETGAPLHELHEVHRSLTALQVIERDAEHSASWRAVSPRVAMARLVTPIEAEARRRAAHAEELRVRLQMLLPVHEARQRSDSLNTVELITDRRALATVIGDEAVKCTTDVMVARGAVDEAGDVLDGCADASLRGVRVRAVVQHSLRYEPAFERLVGICERTGAELRTTDELPVRLVVFDQASCVLAGHGGLTADDGGAVVIRNRLVVATMAALFEEVWDRGHAYHAPDPQPAEVGSELQRAIVRVLAGGAKDELVARRLGMSVRSCRRRIAELMAALDATSRFQAGVEAARRNVV
jgi:hypothetical protein